MRIKIYIWKTTFSSSKQHLFDLLFSRNAKKTREDQKILQTLLLCLKRNVRQTFKSSNCKKVFLKCITDTTCFDKCFLFLVTGRHYWLYKFIVTWKFGETTMLLCSLKKWFEKSPDFISAIYTITLQCC